MVYIVRTMSRDQVDFDALFFSKSSASSSSILTIPPSKVFFQHAKCTFSYQLGEKPMGYHYGDQVESRLSC